MLDIFTDGSTKKNGSDESIGGYALVIMDDYDRVIDCYAEINIPNTTNNRMELTAILAATVLSRTIRYTENIRIYTDSSYAMNCLTNWWNRWSMNNWYTSSGTPVKNKDIIEKYLSLTWLDRKRKNIIPDILYVPGHSGWLGNELADKLATGEMTCEEVMEKYGKKEN